MKEQGTIGVMVVEDHSVVLWGLKKLIDGEAPSMSVVASAGNRWGALAAARQVRPDVVLLDLTLGDESGLDFLPQLREAAGGGRVLVLTALRDSETHRAALRRGASGVVCKDAPAEVVLKAIRKVHEGEVWFDREAAFDVLRDLMGGADDPRGEGAATLVASLTPKEREIISVIASEDNSTNKQVAIRLRISENTLRNHLSSIYDKLGIGNRLELLKFAISHSLA
jgi:two-component system, NarL family, nitrate/nitrite response regulator NarL